MKQKCWITRNEKLYYDLGCQECGRIVFSDWVWHWVIWALDVHIQQHRDTRANHRLQPWMA